MHVSIRIALGLMAGIVGADILPSTVSPLVWLAGLLLVLVSTTPSVGRSLVIAALIGASSLSISLWQQGQAEDHYDELLDTREAHLLEGRVDGLAVVMPGRQQVRLLTPEARIWLTIYSEAGAPLAPLLPGQRIQIFAKLKRPIGLRGLGTVDRRRQMMVRGADLVATASASDLVLLDRGPSLWSLPARIHFWALERITEGEQSQEGRAIVAALATGDRSAMSEPLQAAVRATGIAHLLAVSGMHLGAVVALVFFLVLRTWAYSPWHQKIEARAAAASVALLAAIGFAAMTGGKPSTSRALLVASFVLLGMIIDRRVRLLHALAWSASLLLIWRPVLLWDPGFQLSFAAATTMALAFSRTRDELHFSSSGHVRGLYRGLWSLCRASFWATIATYPLTLYHFGAVSWVGLVTNLVAVPLTTLVLLPSALGGLVLAAMWPGAGSMVIGVSVFVAQQLAEFCFAVESMLPMAIRSPLNLFELACWTLGMLVLLVPSARFSRRRRLLLFAMTTGLLIASRQMAGPLASDMKRDLRVTFVEIGQGDAAVIEAPGGEVWLVDGGGLPFVGALAGGSRQHVAETPARQALLPYLRHRRIDRIDLAIISHPHPDHYVGLQAVSDAMPIVEVWSAHAHRPTPGAYERWLGTLSESGTRVRQPTLGKHRSAQGASLQVLWPRYHEPAEKGSTAAGPDPILSVNDNSLVVRLDFAGRRILFTGDIEAEAEELLVQDFATELRSDVVKVPHHGSPTSSTDVFVAATSATLAVISCGRGNHFGFPNSEVEARWAESAEYLLRTDLVGSVTLQISPSGQMEVSTASEF